MFQKIGLFLQLFLWVSLAGMNQQYYYSPSSNNYSYNYQAPAYCYQPGPSSCQPVELRLRREFFMAYNYVLGCASKVHGLSSEEITTCCRYLKACSFDEIMSILSSTSRPIGQNIVEFAIANLHVDLASCLLSYAKDRAFNIIMQQDYYGKNLNFIALDVLKKCTQDAALFANIEPLCLFINTHLASYIHLDPNYTLLCNEFHLCFAQSSLINSILGKLFEQELAIVTANSCLKQSPILAVEQPQNNNLQQQKPPTKWPKTFHGLSGVDKIMQVIQRGDHAALEVALMQYGSTFSRPTWSDKYIDNNPRSLALHVQDLDALLLMEKYIDHIPASDKDIQDLLCYAQQCKDSSNNQNFEKTQRIWQSWRPLLSQSNHYQAMSIAASLGLDATIPFRRTSTISSYEIQTALENNNISWFNENDGALVYYDYPLFINADYNCGQGLPYYGIMIQALKFRNPPPAIIAHLLKRMKEVKIDPYLKIKNQRGSNKPYSYLLSFAFDTKNADIIKCFAKDLFHRNYAAIWHIFINELSHQQHVRQNQPYIYRELMQNFKEFHERNWLDELAMLTTLITPLAFCSFIFNSDEGCDATLQLLATNKIPRDYLSNNHKLLDVAKLASTRADDDKKHLFAYLLFNVPANLWGYTKEEYSRQKNEYTQYAHDALTRYPGLVIDGLN